VTALDPEVRDLLAALRDALLDPATNRFLILGMLDALVEGEGSPEDAVALLKAWTGNPQTHDLADSHKLMW
jgi:hypothetical protein